MHGKLEPFSNMYSEEALHERVIIHSYKTDDDFARLFALHKPDIIITVGPGREYFQQVAAHSDQMFVSLKWCHYINEPDLQTLANDTATWATEWACRTNEYFQWSTRPLISAFTPAYKTGDRIHRAYNSLKAQTYANWEWIVVDDSPAEHTETWNILQELAQQDYRVKPFKVQPLTGGNIGEAKRRAASMANGWWLLELDHDDALISTCMQEIVSASQEFPDAGFIYTDVAEPYEDGEMRAYTPTIGTEAEWYANPYNTFVWAYGGHEWVEADGQKYLCHIYPDINPKTIRFNIGMPNHARVWRRDVYDQIGRHNRFISVADDYELIVRTFLATRMVHIKKLLYLQYNNRSSTVDHNSTDINRKARLIKDYYDTKIHNRILELGFEDWDWSDETKSGSRLQNDMDRLKYFEQESKLNYIYE